METRTVIGVIGPGDCTPEQARLAEEVGAAIALRGAGVRQARSAAQAVELAFAALGPDA